MYLDVKDLTVLYDRAMVLNKVGFGIGLGEMVSLVGPNGAGKSTCLRAISGLIKWEKDALKGTVLGKITLEGSIKFEDEELINLPAHEIAKRGMILCPERGRPFGEMTVLENLKAGALLAKNKIMLEQNLEKCYRLFPVLEERKSQVSGTLSGGERTMLSIARALMSRPKLLLIDEPSVGLAPKIKEDLFAKIRDVKEMGITIVLVEQDISYAFDLATRNYVISRGKIVAQGKAEELLADEFLKSTYLA